ILQPFARERRIRLGFTSLIAGLRRSCWSCGDRIADALACQPGHFSSHYPSMRECLLPFGSPGARQRPSLLLPMNCRHHMRRCHVAGFGRLGVVLFRLLSMAPRTQNTEVFVAVVAAVFEGDAMIEMPDLTAPDPAPAALALAAAGEEQCCSLLIGQPPPALVDKSVHFTVTFSIPSKRRSASCS